MFFLHCRINLPKLGLFIVVFVKLIRRNKAEGCPRDTRERRGYETPAHAATKAGPLRTSCIFHVRLLAFLRNRKIALFRLDSWPQVNHSVHGSGLTTRRPGGHPWQNYVLPQLDTVKFTCSE